MNELAYPAIVIGLLALGYPVRRKCTRALEERRKRKKAMRIAVAAKSGPRLKMRGWKDYRSHEAGDF